MNYADRRSGFQICQNDNWNHFSTPSHTGEPNSNSPPERACPLPFNEFILIYVLHEQIFHEDMLIYVAIFSLFNNLR